MKSFSLRQKGLGRQVCEDNLTTFKSKDGSVAFFVVSDGMGGHKAGEVASQICVETIEQICSEYVCTTPEELENCIAKSIAEADKKVVEKSKNDADCAEMGATVVLAAVCDCGKIIFANVGDSRGYIKRNGILTQVTRDDSAVQDLIETGWTEEAAKNSIYANQITKAVGFLQNDKPTFYRCDYEKGEGAVVLLCSDGLCSYADKAEIDGAINGEISQEMCQKLADAAIKGNSKDDISIILAEV